MILIGSSLMVIPVARSVTVVERVGILVWRDVVMVWEEEGWERGWDDDRDRGGWTVLL